MESLLILQVKLLYNYKPKLHETDRMLHFRQLF